MENAVIDSYLYNNNWYNQPLSGNCNISTVTIGDKTLICLPNRYVYYILLKGPSWPWSYGSWICNYLCNQCLSPLILWVRILIRVRCNYVIKFVNDLRQVVMVENVTKAYMKTIISLWNYNFYLTWKIL
jgi:phage gp36-like protein